MSVPQKPLTEPIVTSRTARRNLRNVLTSLFILLLVAMTFGISPDDEAAMRTFQTAAWRWQNNPEYRSIAVEYCILADSALRTQAFLVRGPALVLTARSLPFAPHRYALNDTSQTHYSKFSGGPLVAYLYFCGEQNVDEFVGILETVGRKPQPTQNDLREFLDAFHMEYPVCVDAGARQSVAMLVRDTRSDQSFAIRKDVGGLLLVHVHSLAKELGLPPEPEKMTPDQQLAILLRLDDYVKQHDFQLWRTKQLNDFCGGVWAQVYGPHYHLIIGPVLAVRQVGIYGLMLMLGWMILRRGRRDYSREPTQASRVSPDSGVPPSPGNT